MRSSFTSWDACRNIRRHETSRALECADYSIRRTELLKSRSFQNFAPSPDKSAFRSTVCCCLFQGLATIAVLVRVGAERDAFWEQFPQQDYFPRNLSRVAGRKARHPRLR